MKKISHDIVLPDNNILNTLCGIKYLRHSNEQHDLNTKISLIENEACTLPTVYNSFDICYIYMIFSQKCDLSCIYCFEQNLSIKTHKYKNDRILMEQYLEFLTQVRKLYDNICVILYGGEPLQQENYSQIKKLISFMQNKKINLRIITNGMSIDRYTNLFSK